MSKTKTTLEEYKWEKVIKDMTMLAKSLHIESDLHNPPVINYNGADVNYSISATFPSLKERFTKKWLSYFKEREEDDVILMFIQAIYHLGYSQGVAHTLNEMKPMLDLIENLELCQKEK